METLKFLNPRDVELEETIGLAILNPGKRQKVRVIVRDDYVNLLGQVESSEEKRGIESMVRAFPEVRIVTNHIHVKSWEEKLDFSHF